MSQKKKLYLKAKGNPSNLRYDELCQLAAHAGFIELKSRKGSHKKFKRPGIPKNLNFQEGANGKAKDYQVRQLINIIEEYEIEMD